MAIIAVKIKANFSGDHPLAWRGVLTGKPTGGNSATVIGINRGINYFGAGLTRDTIPTVTLPVPRR